MVESVDFDAAVFFDCDLFFMVAFVLVAGVDALLPHKGSGNREDAMVG
ncbi:MAG: hypothetical protein FWD73_10735 [Polyangiaceae bacterium]|nr:hypothetical protein [Polyangiaceae bacterium]